MNHHQQSKQDPVKSDSENISSPNKSKLRVSHHPTTSSNFKKQLFENTDEATLVTFLKPTLTAIQNESQHQRSLQDSLLIVEDEAIEVSVL
jgi:hypothetical protein